MESLEGYRKSIDNIDNAIVAMFAERFKITNKIGQNKAEQGLPAKDETREASQFERVAGLAESYGLDPKFAKDLLKTVIDQVVQNHIEISRLQSAKRPDK
ncbi:chorismate mutase [Marinomonas sp. TW1]|uniref:chorismate mutase n=1 Tax=Marinomonas sp. TW1 TaxID=1561203 RepID=UPI0007AF58D3|nr:chorismate mutase [Marinomonas sp. TW1]KZN14890.1 chorismate mutase [Marinomonas sp. TW1]